MSRIDLKAIDSTFIRGLTAFASGSSSSSVGSSGSSSAAQVSLGLRVGAQTYAQSLQSFNSLISSVNLSKASLEKLGELTDEMIGIAERATKSYISDASRRGLDVQLKKVATKFRKVVDEAEIGDRDLLSKDGLKEVFALVGLDPEKADSISAIFDKIQNPNRDAVLASEENRGSRPVAVPKASYPGASASDSWLIERVSNASTGAAATGGLVSQYSSFWTDDDNYNNQNPAGNTTLASKTTSGNINALASALGFDVELLSVSETSGYALIKSNADFLGENPDNYQQAFIVDSSGQVVQQVTDAGSTSSPSDFSIDAGDLSADGTQVAIGRYDGTDYVLERYSISDLGATPASSVSVNSVYNFGVGSSFDTVKIDEAGQSIAVLNQGRFYLYDQFNSLDVGTAGSGGFADIGFLDTDFVGLVDSAGNTAFATPGNGVIDYSGSLPITGAAVFAFSEAGGSGTIAYRDSAGHVGYAEFGGAGSTLAYTISGTPANITSISLADDGNGGVIIGMFGTMNNDDFTDSTNQLYRLSLKRVSQGEQLTTITTAEPEKILSGTIARRPEAYRMLTDLKALKEQITTNVKALDEALDIIGQNVSLVRATGLAMLDIGNQLTGAEEADDVAKLLRDRIAKNAGVALLAQAENLTPIAYAELNRGLDDS